VPPVPPNILFVLVDTLRADALGVYGQTLPTSPRIDAFAATAVTYDRAWTQYTWTSPSYVSYMTSRYARTHGWDYQLNKPDTFRALDDRAPMLAETLKGAGYATSAQFSQPNLREDLAFNRGFDAFRRGADKGVVNGAVADIRKWAGDGKPNFLYVHLMSPHVPLLPSEASRAAVGAPAKLEKGVSYDWWTGAPADQKEARLEEFRRTYLAGVRDADNHVAAILDALDVSGLADQTAVVITSDHGELIGENGQIGHMASTAEALTHVPLIVKLPGVPARREATPASLIDIAPTLAGLAGAPIPAPWQGKSLLEGGSGTLFSERDKVLAASDGTWKVTEDRATCTFVSAHDLVNDPGEKTAVTTPTNPAVQKLVADASSFCDRIPAAANTGGLPNQDADEKAARLEELKVLGYVE
jgi:arylsulfatase A-like enzyme